jgi:hypothetical protein
MLRKILPFCLSLFLLSACLRPASDLPPTPPPLDFPSPAPGTTPLCLLGDLKTSSNSIDTGEALLLGLTLTNQTKNPCALTNPPQLGLQTGNGQPLEIQAAAMTPVQTPPAPVEVILAPGESVIVSLTWQNYCQPLPKNGLTLQLTLSEQTELKTAIQIGAGPRCDAKDKPSTLTITPYSYPP